MAVSRLPAAFNGMYLGLSTDTKPVSGAAQKGIAKPTSVDQGPAPGTWFCATDTNIWYIFNGEIWQQRAAPPI